MNFDVRYANHPDDSKGYTTQQLRRHYHIARVFQPDEINLTYSHQDRIIAGGIMPTDRDLHLDTCRELASPYFLARRELGVINIGGAGIVEVDGQAYKLDPRDGLYVGMGAEELMFRSLDPSAPAKFYLNSSPAHRTCPTVYISVDKTRYNHLGSQDTVNERILRQYIHPAVCESCQLSMGMTTLLPGNVWNTMPCHTHERRMEVYFYFDLAPDQAVFHMMGQGDETRHIVMHNEQAVISPSWSIHAGVGTSNYTFIWGMCGENQDFDDMDVIPTERLM